jgi:hypothetical protein
MIAFVIANPLEVLLAVGLILVLAAAMFKKKGK